MFCVLATGVHASFSVSEPHAVSVCSVNVLRNVLSRKKIFIVLIDNDKKKKKKYREDYEKKEKERRRNSEE